MQKRHIKEIQSKANTVYLIFNLSQIWNLWGKRKAIKRATPCKYSPKERINKLHLKNRENKNYVKSKYPNEIIQYNKMTIKKHLEE